MNLAYRYPIIYWNTACLSVDSSAINAADFYNLIDSEIIAEDTTEDKKVQNKMDYAKLAAALDKFRHVCKIEMPDINKSRLSFTPDVSDNSILYGLKGICKVTDPAIEEIMMNRPFNSLEDFLNKVTKKIVSKDKVINLIKCGAFNKIEHATTESVMHKYINMVVDYKNKLTMQNANMLIDYSLLPEELEYQCDVYKLTKELRRHRDAKKIWYAGDRLDIPYNKIAVWKQIFIDSKIVPKELVIDDEPRKVIDSAAWDRFYEAQMLKIKDYIKKNHDELLTNLNQTLFDEEYNKYCEGDATQWELDSMNFFFSNHPLNKVIPQLPVEVDRIDQIVEGAQDGQFLIKGKVIPKMKLYVIAGTVIDKDKVKGLVTVQCPSGVVNIKIYKDLFATLNNTIGSTNEMGEKEIEQESFFEKGTHLLITGIQRGATFVPKVYKNTGRNAMVKIVLDENNNFKCFEDKK